MTLVLDATPGGASANTYVDLAGADAYHEARLHTEVWDDADDATKNAGLVMATRVLDAVYEWAAYPSTITQALQWPRNAVMARNLLTYVPITDVPQELKNATAELARQLITADRTLDSDVETQGILALTAGPVSLQFKRDVQAKIVPDAVVSLLPPWWGFVRGRGNTQELRRA